MLFVAIVLTGFVVAAAIRRWSPLRTWQSVASTTLLAIFACFTAGLSLMEALSGSWRGVLTVAGSALAGIIVVHIGALINRFAFDPLRAFIDRNTGDDDVLLLLQKRTEKREVPVGRMNYWALAVRSIRRAQEVRVTGLAAEMGYYGLISLVPLALALGASLGYLERILGPEAVGEIQDSLVNGLTGVFSADVADEILSPLIEGLLAQERTGVAVGSAIAVLWLSSRIFRAAIRALDDAYAVTKRRSIIAQQILGIALSIGAVVTVLVLVALVVVGPLLGDGDELAEQFGLSRFFEVSWAVLRWPAVAALVVAFVTILYRFGPKVHPVWTRCLPGAVLSTIGIIGIALSLSRVLAITGTSVIRAGVEDTAVQAAAQTIGAVLAGMLWMWLTSIALLTGGVINAELDQMAKENAEAVKAQRPDAAKAQAGSAPKESTDPPAESERPRAPKPAKKPPAANATS